MTSIPPNKHTACAYIPEPTIPDFLNKNDESKLERFLNKIDTNDDGKLSRKELSEMADTDNNGLVSQSEKAEMKAKLLEYMKDDNAIKQMTPETLGKAKQMLEFLDGPETFKIPPTLRDILKGVPSLPDAPNRPFIPFIPNEIFDTIEMPDDKFRV